MEKPNIYQQMAAIMADVEHISKGRENKAQGFNFRSIDDMYNTLHKHFAKHQVTITSKVLSMQREERTTRNGGVMIYAILTVEFTFYATDGSSMSSVMIGEGSDTGDKSSNKAMSTALKYALMQTFLIPTIEEKDPDAQSPEFSPKQQPQKETLSAERFVGMLNSLQEGKITFDKIKDKFAFNSTQISKLKELGHA